MELLCLQETHFKYKCPYGLKVKEWRKLYYVNTKQKKAILAILNSDRPDFKARKIIRDKKRYYIIEMGQLSKKT